MTVQDNTVMSPCVGLCRLNERDICEGCYRTRREIANWRLLDDAAKRTIIDFVQQRRQTQSYRS